MTDSVPSEFITEQEAETMISSIWPEVQFPVYKRAGQIWVFSLEFIETKFLPWWKEFKTSIDTDGEPMMEYIEGSGMCEEGVAMAHAWLLKSARKRNKGNPCTCSSFPVNLEVKPHREINGVLGGPGGAAHSTLLLGVRDGVVKKLRLFEWQNEKTSDPDPDSYTLVDCGL